MRAIELFDLPPLLLSPQENAFRISIGAPRKFTDMSVPERIEACYQHSALQYLSSQTLTNTTLRERFKLHDKHRNQVTNASAPQTMVSANIGGSQHLPSGSATPVQQRQAGAARDRVAGRPAVGIGLGGVALPTCRTVIRAGAGMACSVSGRPPRQGEDEQGGRSN